MFLEKNPELKGKPATTEEIENIEKELKINLNKDYKEFISRFGGAYAGIDIYGWSNASVLGVNTVIDLTIKFRKEFEESEFHDEVNRSLVFSDDGSGNPIVISDRGEIVIYYHDSGEKEILSESLGDFIKENFVGWD